MGFDNVIKMLSIFVSCFRSKKKRKLQAKPPTMTTKLEMLDPSTLSDATSTVTYDRKSETVILPGGVVSVAGLTVVTGGTELSCRSCMLAMVFWGTLTSFSCVAVGLWDQMNHPPGRISHLLGLGSVLMGLSLIGLGSIVALHFLTRKKKEMTRVEREDGKEVLVGSGGMIKKVTV